MELTAKLLPIGICKVFCSSNYYDLKSCNFPIDANSLRSTMTNSVLPESIISPLPVWQALEHLPIWDSPTCERLATQLAQGYFLQIIEPDHPLESVVIVELLADGYRGFLSRQDLGKLQPMPADFTYATPAVTAALIQMRIPQVLAYITAAMAQPHCYLWGGTVAPNYDCSGLMQAAFHSVGVNLPRDAYQQEAFCASISLDEIQIGDLLFFGNAQKATHVGICCNYDPNTKLITYLHSSGQEHGHNGIAISYLINTPHPLRLKENSSINAAIVDLETRDRVSHWYGSQWRSVGRVMQSWHRFLSLEPKA